MSRLEESVQSLSHGQSKLAKDISRLRRNGTNMATVMSSIERDSSNLFHSTELDGQLHRLQEQVRIQSDNLRNVSNSVQSVDKVHASTVELFRDIRTLEKKVDKGLSDLRKEVSKCDFDVARVLSLAKGLRQDEVARRESLGGIKSDVLRVQAEHERDRYKILALENLVLNATVASRKAGNEWVSQEVKIANLEVGSTRMSKMLNRNSKKLAHLARVLDRSVNRDVLDEWKRQQEDLVKALRNATDQVPKLKRNITRIEKELGKFEENLPHGEYCH